MFNLATVKIGTAIARVIVVRAGKAILYGAVGLTLGTLSSAYLANALAQLGLGGEA